jgi:hypothetical protein
MSTAATDSSLASAPPAAPSAAPSAPPAAAAPPPPPAAAAPSTPPAPQAAGDRKPPAAPPPPRIATIFVGIWHLALAIATTLLTLLWWPLAEQAATTTVQSNGFSFTRSSGVLLLAIVGGLAGSLVHTITIFGSRVGRGSFEASYVWWNVLRPFGAVLLALIFVAAVHSSLFVLSGGDSTNSDAVAFVAGGLAGLFTDAVLQRLRGALGATSTEKAASEQKVPLAPPPVSKTSH